MKHPTCPGCPQDCLLALPDQPSACNVKALCRADPVQQGTQPKSSSVFGPRPLANRLDCSAKSPRIGKDSMPQPRKLGVATSSSPALPDAANLSIATIRGASRPTTEQPRKLCRPQSIARFSANLAAKLLALDPTLTPEQVIDLIKRDATTNEDSRRHLIDEKRSVALLKAGQEGIMQPRATTTVLDNYRSPSPYESQDWKKKFGGD